MKRRPRTPWPYGGTRVRGPAALTWSWVFEPEGGIQVNRRLVLYGIAGLLTAASGCKKKDGDVVLSGIKVGLLVPDASSPYYQAVHRGVSRIAADRGYEVLLEDGAGSAATQAEALERLVEQGASAIIASPVDAKELQTPIEDAISKGAYVVLLEREVEGPDVSATVVFNHTLAGELLADYLGSQLQSGGPVLVLTGGGTPGEKKRLQAFKRHLSEKLPAVKVAAEESLPEDADGEAVVTRLLTRHKPAAVVAMNADAGAAAAAAIGGGAGKPFVATYGGRESLIEALKTSDSPVRLVVEPLPQWLGDRSAKLAWRIVSNKPTPTSVELPLQPVTRENLDTYHGWDGVIPANMVTPWPSDLSLEAKREE